ncbi:hypothetical protein I302_100170 [Kwoniella bestiolae CBS 10118]|uniref:Uncharacterized protein n=1 Tax=Kwoniella bestiolae CBS 10118 TaxID=1296100 RepID=A0A1B9G4E5_9TREE|nr:hypothetical protein I302_03545 [Kwoniella bestiolae CBS 10118]OCF25871.1 hypothetical protein I302_03545 [Kwoniella bestiolae CBS 10118]
MSSPGNSTGYDPSAGGAGGGMGGYQIDFDQMLWGSLSSTPERTTWWNIFALVLQSLIVSSIVTKTFQYFEYFQKKDNPIYMFFVGLGCSATVVCLGLTCAQSYELVYFASTKFHSIYRFLFMVDQTVLLTGAFFNFSAGLYYSFRLYRMAKSRWWLIPPIVLGLLGPLTSALVCVGKGYYMPTLEMENLPKLEPFFDDYIKASRVWGALTLAIDALLCVALTVLLLRSKDSVFHNEPRLLHKLFALMYESMLPPVVLLVILESAEQVAGSPTSDWRKFLITCIPCLYFHSVLSALIGRQAIRGILDNKLKVEGGVSLLSSSGHGSSGVGKSFNTFSYPSNPTSSRKAEEGRNGEYEMKSESEYGNGSQVSVGGPMVKVRVEHNSATSEPDSYALNHPHLSPIESMSTANRDHSNRIRPPIDGLEDVPYGFSVNRPWKNPSGGVN